MGTEFKAASGRTINIADDGSLLFGRANGYLSRETAFDAEEYFRAKRDEELGRWRYPLDPDWVAQEADRSDGHRTVLVYNELTFERYHVNDRVLSSTSSETPKRAARAFFEAHPERKPWEDAKPGEVWEINGFHAWRLESGAFMFDDESFIFTGDVHRGHRIWPEDVA
jgi:hypothetical protein